MLASEKEGVGTPSFSAVRCARSRPGVQTSSSRPAAAVSACVRHLCSPVMMLERNGTPAAAIRFATPSTCCASSEVGVSTTARTCPAGVRPLTRSASRRLCTRGARYAIVLPEPV